MNSIAAVRSDFVGSLYQQVASARADENLFFSSFSIQLALAMCAAGAKGETRRVMAELIGAPENVDEQNHQYAALLKSVNGDGKRPFQLVTANALWGQQGCQLKPDFQEAIADFYDGALHIVNFLTQPDEAVAAINAWVGNKTRGRIKELVQRDSFDKDTRLVLTNAIYFKSRWENDFYLTSTQDEKWFGPSGTGKVPMMHETGQFTYFEDDTFQALDLPYRAGQLVMQVVLPKKRDGLVSLESQWSGRSMYQQATAQPRYKEQVVVSLPRFKVETEFNLKPVLSALGIGLAFTDHADFSGICQEPLRIAEVIHEACVEVNEKGTEAAAATAAVHKLCAYDPQKPKIFNADHPFLFFIRDAWTDAVLFCGRLLDPS